jgi:hypothetical protein
MVLAPNYNMNAQHKIQIGDIPEWTEEDTKIIQEYEDDRAKGNISDFVIIPRDIE